MRCRSHGDGSARSEPAGQQTRWGTRIPAESWLLPSGKRLHRSQIDSSGDGIVRQNRQYHVLEVPKSCLSVGTTRYDRFDCSRFWREVRDLPLHPRVKAFAGRVWRDFPTIYKDEMFKDDGPDQLDPGSGIVSTLAEHIRIKYYTAGCTPPARPLRSGIPFARYMTALAELGLINDLEKQNNLSAPLWTGPFKANPVVDDRMASDHYYLHNGRETPQRRYYIHAQPEHVPAVMGKVKSLVEGHPSTNAKCMGPAEAHRDDCIVVYATEGVDDAAIMRIITDLAWLRAVNMDAAVNVRSGISRGPGTMQSWGHILSMAIAGAFATDVMEGGARLEACKTVREFLTPDFIRDNAGSFCAAVAERLRGAGIHPMTLEAISGRVETSAHDESAPRGRGPRPLGRKVARVLPSGHQNRGKGRPAAQPRIKHSAVDPPPVPSRSTKPPLTATDRPPVPSRSTKPPLTTAASSSASDRVRPPVAGGPPTAGFNSPSPKAPAGGSASGAAAPRGGVPTPLAHVPVRSAGPVPPATSGRDPAASSSVGPTGGPRQRTHNPLIHELHEHSAFRAKQKKEGT